MTVSRRGAISSRFASTAIAIDSRDDKIKTRLAQLGVVVQGGTPAEFGKFIASETAKWGKVIRNAGIKPD